jgi:CheY-like chemotaxis protein
MTILIAEDEDYTRRILCDIVKNAPERPDIVAVANGADAWRRLRGTNIAMAILDVMMPEMDGLEVLERIRQDPELSDMPVLLCSAKKDRRTIVRAAALKVSDYLAKPYSAAAVLEKLKKISPHSSGQPLRKEFQDAYERLRIDYDGFLTLHTHLHAGVTDWLDQVRTAVRWSEIKALGLRAANLSQMAKNLGALDLACQLAHVDSSFASCAGSAIGGDGLLEGCSRHPEVRLMVERVQAELGVLANLWERAPRRLGGVKAV